MPKFKVGDRVRVTNVSDKHSWIKHLEGVSGVVKKVFKCANQDVGCYDIGLDYIINEPELELVLPKFKVGNQVRIVAANHSQDKALIGDIYTVDMVDKRDCTYILNDRYKYIWMEDELELVKPKFNINDYPGKCIMHVKTEEEAKTYLEYLHKAGRRWCSGIDLLDHTHFYVYRDRTCYSCVGDSVAYGTADVAYINDTILEFEDFDWSDFTMKKEFTKKDLKNGDVIKRRCGSVEIVCIDTGTIITKNGWNDLKDINDDLTHKPDTDWDGNDIVAVRRPNEPIHCNFDAFDRKYGTLVYERKEVEEMTLEEVCKALGKDIKIIKK